MPPPLRKRAASPTDINKHTARAFPMNGKSPGPRQPGAQRRGRPAVSKRSVQTVANNTDVNVSLRRGVRRGYGHCLAPGCAPRVCP